MSEVECPDCGVMRPHTPHTHGCPWIGIEWRDERRVVMAADPVTVEASRILRDTGGPYAVERSFRERIAELEAENHQLAWQIHTTWMHAHAYMQGKPHQKERLLEMLLLVHTSQHDVTYDEVNLVEMDALKEASRILREAIGEAPPHTTLDRVTFPEVATADPDIAHAVERMSMGARVATAVRDFFTGGEEE